MTNNYHTINNALDWARKEYQCDSKYWLERAENGTGLIKQIAEFVLGSIEKRDSPEVAGQQEVHANLVR